MVTCKIQWIDCVGYPTPDNRPAVAYAAIGDKRYPICADHAAWIQNPRRGTHFDPSCNHAPGAPANWHIEPLEEKA